MALTRRIFFNIWELYKLVIISYNLMTFTFDTRVILQEKLEASHPQGLKASLTYINNNNKLQNTVKPH